VRTDTVLISQRNSDRPGGLATRIPPWFAAYAPVPGGSQLIPWLLTQPRIVTTTKVRRRSRPGDNGPSRSVCAPSAPTGGHPN